MSYDTPTCRFKHDLGNLVSLHPATKKFESFTSTSSFCPKCKDLRWKENTEELSFMTLKSNAKLNNTLTLRFQTWHEEKDELSLK